MQHFIRSIVKPTTNLTEWNKEDEKMLEDTILIVKKRDNAYGQDTSREQDWLKDLPHRFNLSLAEAQDLERKYIKEAKDAGISLNQNNGGTPGSITSRSKTCNPKEDSMWHFVPIRVYKNGEFVGDYESLHQASRDLGIPRRSLQRILKDGTQMRNGYSIKKM